MPDSGYILIVDDEEGIRFGLKNLFIRNGYKVFEAENISSALSIVRKEEIDIALIDIQLGNGENGIELLRQLKNVNEEIQVIMITGYGSIDTAVASIKRGASNYILKPIKNDKILNEVKRTLEYSRLKTENLFLKKELNKNYTEHEIITENKQMKNVLSMADQIKNAATNILILGESGSGKEVLARYIHFTGSRANGNFISLNSASISDSLILSELFGHVKGAFTGAVTQKAGMFELADGGTLFLDEIGDMHIDVQAKLLRVIEERCFQRLGGVKKIDVDFQLIVATNKDLGELIKKGLFREDLYYRLNVISLNIPALRDRSEDILPLSRYFIEKYNLRYSKRITGLDTPAEEVLKAYNWPGNIRELQNVINRAVLLGQDNLLTTEDLEIVLHNCSDASKDCDKQLQFSTLPNSGSLHSRMEGVITACETKIIKDCLMENNNIKTKTAEVLDITRKTLFTKMKQYEI